ncbi:MAG: leucine-rich repeat protein, partial [Muribaculaceae bacterium]|nr:leucine-rich repeat protein [Muribaculaceae bacterium]
YTNTTLTFDIKECQIGGYEDGTNSYVASNQQRISNINKVIVYKHGNLPSSSDPYLYSTKITLYKTGSSSYPQTSNINSWTNASGVTMLPTNTQYNSSSKALTNSSYALYNYDIVISNMQNNSSYTAIGNYLYKKGTFNGSSCATLVAPTYNYFNSAPTSISVPGYVTLSGSYLPVYIGQDAFSNWQRVQSITLCYGVAGISAYAMQYMDNLQAIYIPSSVKSIGSYAFKGSSGTVGNFNVFWSQSNVGDVISTYSFYDIQPGKSNKKVYFPTWLDADNANRVSALTNIMTVQTGAGYPALCHDFTYNGNAYVVHDATNNKVALVGSATSPTPSSMSLTSSNATFKATTDYGGKTYTCNNIASYAFYGQTSLISFTTSYQGIEYIGEHAFDGCTKLTSVTLPEGLKTIWNNAFSNTAITSLSIPASVTSIKTDNEGDVFSNCQQLSEINVASGNSYYSSHNAILYNKAQTTVLKMPEAWAYYGYHHIGNMQDNDGIGFPNTLTTIGPRAFSRTNKVQSIFLPYGVTTIGAEAFRAAKALQAVHIPSSVTSCNWTGPLFYYCTSLKE